jgi:hypothetical protein
MSDSYLTLYCANHPDVETRLRCNNCEKPICPKCAVLTPTGYRCKDCVRSHQKVFETAEWYDYPLAFIITIVLSYLGSLITAFIGFFIIFVAPIIGVIIAEAVRLAVRRKRSLRLYQLTALAAVLGSLPPLIPMLVNLFLGGNLIGGVLSLLWQGLYTFTVTTTIYYRLRGINIK